MTGEHIGLKTLIAYVTRNEYPMTESDITQIERHIAACVACRKRYDEMQARYVAMGPMKDPKTHLEMLNREYARRKKLKRGCLYALSGLAAAAVIFVALSAILNYRYNHGPVGLAEFENDYAYAQVEDNYRGSVSHTEREDIRLFKQGVIALFGARRSVLTFPAVYDMDRVNEAERLFLKADTLAQDDLLKKKIRQYREKIAWIRE